MAYRLVFPLLESSSWLSRSRTIITRAYNQMCRLNVRAVYFSPAFHRASSTKGKVLTASSSSIASSADLPGSYSTGGALSSLEILQYYTRLHTCLALFQQSRFRVWHAFGPSLNFFIWRSINNYIFPCLFWGNYKSYDNV